MKEIFEQIASQIPDCELNIADSKIHGRRIGSRISVSVYELKFYYNTHLIIIKNELGLSNMGKICTVLNRPNIPDFEITTRDHFSKLFSRNKATFKIKCKDSLFSDFIQRKINLSMLEKIAEDNLFEPKIHTCVSGLEMEIITDYHLEFKDKMGALSALIHFYKSLIDYPDRSITNRILNHPV